MGKGRLVLVGIGISDELGISLRGLEELKACSSVFAELYTNLVPEGTLGRLGALCGKSITALSRQQVEGEREILESAVREPTALVVPGDPMIATTHVSLVLAARKKGIPVAIIHASSILSAAIGESGLQAYKFGKAVTLAYWRESYRPMATYDVVAENLSRGLHTLLLLDIDEKLGPMTPQEAARLLLEMEKLGKKRIFLPAAKVILLQGAGWKGQKAAFLPISEIASAQAQPPGPAVLIVPGKLHFLEEEFLSSL